MGLLDILNGMQNGPRGPSEPRPSDPQDKGGMSPITMAILALLAYKAVKHFGGGSGPAPEPGRAPGRSSVPPSGPMVNAGLPGGGGWSDMLKGGLGGLLAGGAAGSILSGGLGDLLRQFQQNGQGDVADSWVQPGPNKQISPNDLASALGADQIDALSSQTGLSRSELLDGLSQQLPDVIDRLTPEGRLPTDDEASRWI
uniref:DUF937 domain-containing protein n=1 Tax=Rhodopseudomonas palustris (strain BisA53) TaxID=316055 RepID=Q07VF7_RHOP5